jgi:hypothetical protein
VFVHLHLCLVGAGMIRGPTARCAKPLVGSGVPRDSQVLGHFQIFMNKQPALRKRRFWTSLYIWYGQILPNYVVADKQPSLCSHARLCSTEKPFQWKTSGSFFPLRGVLGLWIGIYCLWNLARLRWRSQRVKAGTLSSAKPPSSDGRGGRSA